MNMTLLSVCLAVALSAGAKKKEETSAAQKGLIKDAIADSASSDGTMPFTPESVKTVVTYWQPRIQACYEETLASKDKDVQGTLKTKWVVGGSGIVKKAEIVKKGTTLKDPKLHDCVIAVLSSMTFPKTPNGKDQPIEFPFNLKAVH
jgi:hypothetical protein